MRSLLDLFSLREPFERRHVFKRLRPLIFTEVTSANHDECLSIHERCEDAFLPSAHRPIFAHCLESNRSLMLLAHLDKNLVGCCGIQWSAPTLAWICYGLVLPPFRRQGIGTTMFFARMSLLETEEPLFTVGMSAIAANFTFYARLGFQMRHFIPAESEDGNRYPVALLEGMNRKKVGGYRAAVEKAGIVLPPNLVIPLVPMEEPPQPTTST